MIDIFIPLLLGLLLAYLLVIWPTLFVGHTASKPKLEHTSSNTVNYACFAATDQVNLYRSWRMIVNTDFQVFNIGIEGFLRYNAKRDMRLYTLMMCQSERMEPVSEGDKLVLRLANDSVITLQAIKNGSVKVVTKRRRRTVPKCKQEVYYAIEESQLEAICKNEIVSVVVKTRACNYKVDVNKAVSGNINKRYNMLINFFEDNSSMIEEPQIADTVTNDPTITRFARMSPVKNKDDIRIVIGGYKDQDGDVSILWENYMVFDKEHTVRVQKNNGMVIRFENGEKVVLFAYGKGYIKQLNDSLYEQRVSYRITAPQLDSICNNEIKSISIHMGKMGYKSKMRQGVSEDLQIRYNMLMDYLLENSSE